MAAGWTSTRSKNPLGATRHCRLRPLTFFPLIVAAFSACFGRCDGWGVQNADGRLRARFNACRARLRTVSLMVMHGLSRFHGAK